MSKNELVDMVITSKPKTTKYLDRENELTKEEAIELIRNKWCLQIFKNIYNFYLCPNKYMQSWIWLILLIQLIIHQLILIKKFRMIKELKEIKHRLMLY